MSGCNIEGSSPTLRLISRIRMAPVHNLGWWKWEKCLTHNKELHCIVHKLPELSSHSFSYILIMAYIFGTMVMDGVRLTLNEGKSVGKPTLKPYINYIYHHAIINQ